MKKTYLIVFTLSLAVVANAQKETNIWYFGYGAGIDFNSGTAVAITDGSHKAREGVASISDASGSLLFYTNGSTVWDKTHAIMNNGTGLMGDSDATQAATIVPKPGSSTQFYIFTTPNAIYPNGPLSYSLVDMTFSGGLGAVIVKNLPLFYGSSEKCMAIYKYGTPDVWLIAHDHDSTFLAYRITTSGISAPVTSKHALHTSPYNYSIGYMKASPKGDKIAACISSLWNDPLMLYDFDCNTGIVSNEKMITQSQWLYGLEFSPDGSKLYAIPWIMYQPVNQFDITLGSAAAISASQVSIGTITHGTSIGGAALGPDGKIYIAKQYGSYLAVINSPNLAGVASNFVDSAFYLSGKASGLGLPALIRGSVCGLPAPPTASFQANDTTPCANDCINFTDLSTNATSWLWTFTGASPSSSTNQHPSVCYLSSGNFNVTLVAMNGGGSDAVTMSNYINVKPAPPTPVITQSGATLYCATDPSYTSYQWYDSTALIPGATDTALIITHGGNYNVQVTNANGCKGAVGINVVLGTKSFTIYDLGFTIAPNPVRQEVRINHATFRIGQIEIYNVLGVSALPPALLQRRGEDAVIDVSKLPPGIYFLQLKTESGSITKKFVKE